MCLVVVSWVLLVGVSMGLGGGVFLVGMVLVVLVIFMIGFVVGLVGVVWVRMGKVV